MRLAGLIGLLMLSLSGCSCGASEAKGNAGIGGAPGDSGLDAAIPDVADADGDSEAIVWDPVWHETAPKEWPKAPNASADGCGDGCRVVLDVIPVQPAYLHFQDGAIGLGSVNGDLGEFFFARFDSDDTLILGARQTGNEGFAAPGFWGDYASVLFVRDQNTGGEVRIVQLLTGESKVAYEYDRGTQDLGVGFTVLNGKYVFWDRVGTGIMSRNLQTGEVRLLVHFDCEDLCATPNGLVCFNSPNYFIDQETGEMTAIAAGDGLQIDGTCSYERDEIIWIDYRDPPGPGSSYWGHRSGGEVYTANLGSGEVTRLTHDSPDAPQAKAYPAVGHELAVWKGVSEGLDLNPEWGQDVYAVTQDLIVLDRSTGTRCRIHSDLVKYFTHMVVVGRWVYGSMGYVVGIDVDNPAIGCVKE